MAGEGASRDVDDGLHRHSSLDEAFRARGVPLANQEFVRKLLDPLDVVRIESTSSYIKVSRADSRTAIQVSSGYSNGFLTEDEITRAVGDVDRWHSARGQGRGIHTWGVSHPINALREGGGSPGQKRDRDYGVCLECFQLLPATRICSACSE